MRSTLTGAVAVAVVVLASTVACGAGARQPHADATHSPATSAARPPAPSATAFFGDPDLPGGQCPYLTTAQIQAALGQPVRHVAGCAYFFANGAGSFGLTDQTFSSLPLTRLCYRQGLSQARGLFPGHGFTIRQVPGTGSQAVSLILPHGGAQAIFVRGTTLLAVFVLWPPAQRRPQIAVTLLREAAKNLGRHSAPVSAGCS